MHYIMQRINKHLNNMKLCYFKHILVLDNAIIKHHHDEYGRLYKCRHEFSTEIIVGTDTSDMLDNLDMKFQAERDHKRSLFAKFNELRIQHDEVTHSIKMQMEHDQEKIEMELEEMTATYFFNSLKFNYNYQVLEKKNIENVNKKVFEEKKKNWFKVLHIVSDVRKQIKETKSTFHAKSIEITDHTEKFRDRLLKLEVKVFNGARVNESKVSIPFRIKAHTF